MNLKKHTKSAVNRSFHRLSKHAFEHDIENAFSVLWNITNMLSKIIIIKIITRGDMFPVRLQGHQDCAQAS
jgi:hypothetical protein